MNIVAIVGSTSKGSYNKKLVKYIKKRYKDKINIDILSIKEFPMYNEDTEFDIPLVVKEVKEKIRKSDGVLIATPEYNNAIPGVLKNALDWFSRGEQVMVDKPTMIIGASRGFLGTVKAQINLKEILSSRGISALTLPGNDVYIGNVQDKLDEEGELIHLATVEFLDRVVDNFIEWVKKVG